MLPTPFLIAIAALYGTRAYTIIARERGLRIRWAQKRRPSKSEQAHSVRVPRAELEHQVCEFCRDLSNGLRAGQSVLQCLMRMADDFSGPLGHCIAQSVRQFSAGVPLLEALLRESSYLGSHDFSHAVRVLGVFEQTGSDPAEALSQVATNAQERLEMRAALAAKLVDARTSAVIVATLPVVIGFSSLVTNKKAIMVTLETPHGRVLMSAGMLLWAAGSVICWNVANPRWLR